MGKKVVREENLFAPTLSSIRLLFQTSLFLSILSLSLSRSLSLSLSLSIRYSLHPSACNLIMLHSNHGIPFPPSSSPCPRLLSLIVFSTLSPSLSPSLPSLSPSLSLSFNFIQRENSIAPQDQNSLLLNSFLVLLAFKSELRDFLPSFHLSFSQSQLVQSFFLSLSLFILSPLFSLSHFFRFPLLIKSHPFHFISDPLLIISDSFSLFPLPSFRPFLCIALQLIHL